MQISVELWSVVGKIKSLHIGVDCGGLWQGCLHWLVFVKVLVSGVVNYFLLFLKQFRYDFSVSINKSCEYFYWL